MPDDSLEQQASTEQQSQQDTQDDRDVAAPDDPLANDEDLQKCLFDLYLKCSAEDRYPRLVEVKDTKQAEFYWGGRQYIWWSDSDKKWNLPTQAQVLNFGDMNVDDMPRFEFVTNIYQATGLQVIGAISSAPPRNRFYPDDPDNPDDIETADGRKKLSRIIQRWNPIQKLLQEAAYHAWTGGFIAFWTHYVEDGDAFGFESKSVLSPSEESQEDTLVCPSCGWSVPSALAVPPVPCPECGASLTSQDIVSEDSILSFEESDQEVPKGRESITCYGALNCKRPQHTDAQSEWHYFSIEEEIHYAKLRAVFQDKADKIKAGLSFGADEAFERNARLSVAENTKLLTQTAASQAHLATFARIWFRPTAFWIIDDQAKRQKLLDLFPRGCRAEFAGSVYCKSKAESMDAAITAFSVMLGRGQHRPAIGSSMISIQDRFNTFTNIAAETYEYGIPITYRASDTFASEADDDQRAAPGLEVEVNLNPGENIQQRIMQVRADSISPDMYKHMMDIFGPITQYISGVFPALTGAGEGAPETLGQQSMQRDQAMGRMGVFYVRLKQAIADIITLACRDFEENAEGQVKIPVLGETGDFEAESVDVTALEGEARAYPEGDENFPELWNQQRATMMQIMDTPYGMQLSQDPDNTDLLLKLTGIPELKAPGQDARKKQLREINEIVETFERMQEQAPPDGAPLVEVDPDADFHTAEIATCMWFLNSLEGQKLKRENPAAWMAVKAHMMQHKQFASQQAQNAPPPPPKETMTTQFKDMPPEAQAQFLAKYGINVTPQDFLAGALLKSVGTHKESVPVAPNTPPAPQPAPMSAGGINA